MSDPLARHPIECRDGTLFAPPREIAVPKRRGHRPIAETSRAALRAGAGVGRDNDRLRILRLIVTEPRTCDEVAAILERPQNAVSGRFTELSEAGLIQRTESRRATRSGSSASVWSATGAGLSASKVGGAA